MQKYDTMKQWEFECECGYVWIDDKNYSCPLCGERDNIVRRDYVIKQPCEFSKRKLED